MSALRLRNYLPPLISVRSNAHRMMVLKQARQLRLWQRCVAATRLGVSRLRPTVQLSIYMGLR
jgi:hypothetical protein